MRKFHLRRFEMTIHHTLGKLYEEMQQYSDFFCYTVELPWRDNKPNVSCVPPGTYQCVLKNRHPLENRFELKYVPGRTGIQFHIANLPEDLDGCIGVGEMVGNVGGTKGVLFSGFAYKRFMKSLENDKEFILEITDG